MFVIGFVLGFVLVLGLAFDTILILGTEGWNTNVLAPLFVKRGLPLRLPKISEDSVSMSLKLSLSLLMLVLVLAII